jgi:hypothetical protein
VTAKPLSAERCAFEDGDVAVGSLIHHSEPKLFSSYVGAKVLKAPLTFLEVNAKLQPPQAMRPPPNGV